MSEITNVRCDDHGMTYDGGESCNERTIIVRGTMRETGKEIAGALLLDLGGTVIDSQEPFFFEPHVGGGHGAHNYEYASHLAANGAGPLAGLLELEMRTAAEVYAKQHPIGCEETDGDA